MPKKKYLSLNVKVPEHKAQFQTVWNGSLQTVIFPEDLIERTICTDTPWFQNVIYRVKPKGLPRNWKHYSHYADIIKKRSVYDSIRRAAQNYQYFPLNKDEYVKLLWSLFEDTTDVINYIVPIILSSPNNNMIRLLYMVLVQSKKAVVKLAVYNLKPKSKKLFEKVFFKLTDNVMTCNRILLACCYVQNSNQSVNMSLQKLITISIRLETLVAFISTAILQSGKRVRTYKPSGYIIRLLRCSRCNKIVSLSGCVCTNWKLDTLTPQQLRLYTNSFEDGPMSSRTKYIKSWEDALKLLMALPAPSEPRVHLQPSQKRKVNQIQIREPDENKTSLKRKASETIDEVRLTTKVRSFLNEWKLTHEGEEMTKENYKLELDFPAIKRKAVEPATLMDILNSLGGIDHFDELVAAISSDEDGSSSDEDGLSSDED